MISSSNLSVGKIYSVVELRMSVLFLYQIMCCHITEFAIKKIWLILARMLDSILDFSNLQSFSRCSGGFIIKFRIVEKEM